MSQVRVRCVVHTATSSRYVFTVEDGGRELGLLAGSRRQCLEAIDQIRAELDHALPDGVFVPDDDDGPASDGEWPGSDDEGA